MPENRWDKIGSLLEEARGIEPEWHEDFLTEQCEDPELREEVRSLLQAQTEAEGFFEELEEAVYSGIQKSEKRSGPRLPSKQLSDPLELEGKTVGHYEVKEFLGGGGMGIVYRARDPELDRAVALKFLPPHLARSREVEERFEREAKAAAALDHAHIGTVHEIGEAEVAGGRRRFIAMTYYEGETLKEKLAREGRLPVEKAVGYAEQIAEALARAHEAGIVHRDVKPANVMITERGEVKLVDFGLARLGESSRLTRSGQQLGTASYMSPEQARGEEVGPPTDLWALGIVLYEMIAGERPYQGSRPAAVLYSVLHEEPVPLGKHRAEVEAGLEQVIQRCLKKEPGERYESAAALLEDLQAVASEEGPASIQARDSSLSRYAGWSHPRTLSGAAALVLVLVGSLTWTVWPVEKTETAPSSSTVAVLPFEVSGSGVETWRDGMVTALSLNLDGAAGLRAISDRTVLAAWEKQSSADEEITAENALAVARDVGAKYAIVGSAVQLGTVLRLGAVVRRTTTGERLGHVEVRGRPDSITVLTDRLTRQVLEVLLQRSEETIPSVDLASITTRSLPAFKAFLEGERHFRAGAYGEAARHFEQATEADSSFALAYARLERTLGWSGKEGKVQALRRACTLVDQLPDRARRLVRSRCRGVLENRDLAEVDSLRRISEAYPQDPQVWYNLGEALFHGWVPGGWRESEEAFQRAVRLDSGAAPYHQHLNDLVLALHRDSARATRQIQGYPEEHLRSIYKVFSTLIFGKTSDRQTAWSRLEILSLPNTRFPYWVRWPFLHPKDLDLQERVIRQILRRGDTRQGPYMEVLAENYLLRGKVDALRPLLRKDGNQEEAACLLAVGMSLQYPISDSLLRAHLDLSTMGTEASVNQLLCTGIYLIERARTEKIPELMTRLKASIVDATETTEEARNQLRVVSNELEGYRAWRTGRLAQAARYWSASKWSWWWWGGATGALWRGDLYRELGEVEEAEEWYRAAWTHPVAQERLGRLYEEMGETEKAQSAYRRFIEAWKEADPELQNRVEKARERLQALEGRAVTGGASSSHEVSDR